MDLDPYSHLLAKGNGKKPKASTRHAYTGRRGMSSPSPPPFQPAEPVERRGREGVGEDGVEGDDGGKWSISES